MDAKESAILPINNATTSAITLSNAVPSNGTPPMFLVMGMAFYQEKDIQQL